MQGIFDFEFIGDLFDECFTLKKITILRQVGNSPDFIPVHGNASLKPWAISATSA